MEVSDVARPFSWYDALIITALHSLSCTVAITVVIEEPPGSLHLDECLSNTAGLVLRPCPAVRSKAQAQNALPRLHAGESSLFIVSAW